jgi:hypothetical protein
MTLVSDIKLIRTDTTLDLSQKAEKGILHHANPALLILPTPSSFCHPYGTNPAPHSPTFTLLLLGYSKFTLQERDPGSSLLVREG